ncbi:PH domain-containing protein [Candidatus Saccharibacteria bacterium]|nr:PH domain-containing protein [Candidatus Saccharibacteria bacterium]
MPMHRTQAETAHREQAQQKLSSEGRKYFNLIEFDENEDLVTEIRKDPFGLFLILFTGIFVGLTIMIITVLLSAADLDGLGFGNLSSFRGILLFISLLLILGVAIMTFIGAFLYRSNVIYVTTEKLAQVVYISLFNRKISQLSIGDIQDVTVTQKGIFAHLFKYGTLVVETAGEQQNYTFSFVPDPYQVSTLIVGAHERNLALHGN